MKKSSLTIKTLFILSSFVILILLSLWVIQVKMTGIFYERHQVKRINYVASKVQSQSSTLLDFSLEKYAYKYDMCIELDKDCYEVKEQKKEETDDWLKEFKLE